MGSPILTTLPPQASRAVVEAAVRRALSRGSRERIIALRAAPEWRGAESFVVDGHGVDVRGCQTVLAVLDAVSAHTGDGFLVLLTPQEDLGDSLLARIADHELRPVNRFDLVRESFGAKLADPRLSSRSWAWLAEALIDAQPPAGWPKLGGGVLTLETALSTLVAARFGGDPDATTLLTWSSDNSALAAFRVLPETERAGLSDWLETEIGSVASVVFRLVETGHAVDAIPLGLVASAVYHEKAGRRQVAMQAKVRIEERFLGGARLAPETVRQFAESVESLWTRWLAGQDTLKRAETTVARAESILAELQAESLADLSDALDLGFDARLAALANQLIAPGEPRELEEALNQVREHRRAAQRTDEMRTAEMAVRLARWLRSSVRIPQTLDALAVRHVREWGWADRAIAALWQADTARVPKAKAAYAAIYEAARRRRTELDEAFARRLESWTLHGSDTNELVLAENLLVRVVRPLAAPVVIVLDGMSAAVACELADDILRRWAWTEVGRRSDGREPGLAVVPSMTRFSRTSLLCGELRDGTQRDEVPGFRAMWPGRKSALFHKGNLAGDAGAKLDDEVLTAIAEQATVVGVVLNAVDDSLDKGPTDGGDAWKVDGVAYLKQVLEAAWAAGRSVVLTSDHGHILQRETPVTTERSSSARYRTGTPGTGEVLLRGPRVLAEDGAVVVAWEESIRYTSKHAGYHGGAALAEMVIPILAFVPSARHCPPGWQVFDSGQHTPSWWSPPVIGEKRPARAVARPKQEDALFSVADLESLGARVTSSETFAAQRAFVRNAPAAEQMVKLIDGLATAGGKLPVNVAADLVGQAPARMRGYVSQVSRLLNLEGYGVLTLIDGDRTVALDVSLLKLQFLGET